MIKKANLTELLPLGEQANIAKILGVPRSVVQYHLSNGLKGDVLVCKQIKEYVEEHFPEVFEGDYVYVLTSKDNLGLDIMLAVCTSREEAEKVINDIECAIPLDAITTKKVAVDAITPEARRLFVEKPVSGTPLSSIDMGYGRASSSLRRILTDLGCRTLEDVAEIPVDVIMSQKGANARTKFILKNLFIENNVPYNTEEYSE